VTVTGWTEARIPWPRCRSLDTHGGGSGILLDEELARAVRCESAAAVMHWWGVSSGVVWRWRKALSVTITSNEGSHRLIRASAEKGGKAFQAHEFTADEREHRRRTARELNLARHLRPGYHGPLWTPAQLRLLGTAPDDVVAARVGRTANAVRVMRTRLGIPTARDGRRK